MALNPQIDGETSDDLRASLAAQFDAIDAPATDTPAQDAAPVDDVTDAPDDVPDEAAPATFRR